MGMLLRMNMVIPREFPRPSYTPARKYRRFDLHYPVRLRFGSGTSFSELQARSRNLSVGGMLLESSSPIPDHSPVSFTITVDARTTVRPIQLVGEGRVVRVEEQGRAGCFAIAVECNRPLAEMQDCFASS